MPRPLPCALLLATTLLAPSHAWAQEKNLLPFGDFETLPHAAPPRGWVMWGEERWKKPGHYTQDGGQPHSGQGALRIFRPAGSGGYVVNSLTENPVRPAKDRLYRFSFWARTDTPAPSRLEIQGFTNPQTYSGYSAPGSFAFSATREWRQFTFDLTEGLDFFADAAPHLMLAFHPLAPQASDADKARAKTLWIDDVKVMELPLPPGTLRLVNPANLPYEPLNHRLLPAPTLQMAVSLDKVERPANRAGTAVSFHRLSGFMGLPYDRAGNYRLTESQEAAIRALRLPHTRFYGVGDEAYPLPQALEKASTVLARTGISPAGTVLELEDQSANTRLAPEIWAQAARYSQDRNLGFDHWEVSNEPWHRPAFKDASDYAAHVQSVSKAVKTAQPQAKIGMAFATDGSAWGNYLLRAAAGSYDFIAPHWYSFIDATRASGEDVVLGENYRILGQIRRTQALLQAYNPGRAVYQYDTEWSLHSMTGGSANQTRENGAMVGALHRAVRLVHYAGEDMVRGASAWEMFSATGEWNALGLLPERGEEKSLLYWTHRLFNEHLGADVLRLSGTAPYYYPAGDNEAGLLAGPLTPALVTVSADRSTVYAIVVNASAGESIPATLQLEGFVPLETVAAVALSEGEGQTDNTKPPAAKISPVKVVSTETVPRTGTASLNWNCPPQTITFVQARRFTSVTSR